MAKGQQNGGRAGTVWMIIFATLWLGATVLAVVMYTGREEQRIQIKRLTDGKARLITSSQERSLNLLKQVGPNQTVVGLLEEQRSLTAELASGDGADDAGIVQTKLDDLLVSIRDGGAVSNPNAYDGVSYHEALTSLNDNFKSEHTLRTTAQQRVGELETEVDRLAETTNAQKNDFDTRAANFTSMLAEIEKSRDGFRKEQDTKVATLQTDFDQRRTQNDADLTAERQSNAALRKQVSLLEERVAALGSALPGPERLSTARRPDGVVLRAIPGDDVVYINRGKRHRLTLGLRFAVYSSGDGIPVDGRAKAQIEVVSIDQESAECKKIRVAPGQVILEDDLVANPIYDPDRSVTFLVLGEFDLDHDRVHDADGAAVIESMVAEWGGTVAAELDALTDFIVLGASPRRPRPVRDESTSSVSRFNAQKQVYDNYMNTVRLAKSLGVTILNQQVFLNFLGYNSRYASR